MDHLCLNYLDQKTRYVYRCERCDQYLADYHILVDNRFQNRLYVSIHFRDAHTHMNIDSAVQQAIYNMQDDSRE